MNVGFGLFDRDHEDVRKPYKPRGRGLRIDPLYLAARAPVKPEIGLAAAICRRADEPTRLNVVGEEFCLCDAYNACLSQRSNMQAARRLGIPITSFNRYCRKMGLMRPSDLKEIQDQDNRRDWLAGLQETLHD